ncbi:hypothetical protein [Nocardia lijiangensis]
MPRPYPEEVRRYVVAVARKGESPLRVPVSAANFLFIQCTAATGQCD